MSSHKRFVVLGGPGGYLSCRPAGCPMITDQYKRWQILFTVNRPPTIRWTEAAKDAALRCYELGGSDGIGRAGAGGRGQPARA